MMAVVMSVALLRRSRSRLGRLSRILLLLLRLPSVNNPRRLPLRLEFIKRRAWRLLDGDARLPQLSREGANRLEGVYNRSHCWNRVRQRLPASAFDDGVREANFHASGAGGGGEREAAGGADCARCAANANDAAGFGGAVVTAAHCCSSCCSIARIVVCRSSRSWEEG